MLPGRTAAQLYVKPYIGLYVDLYPDTSVPRPENRWRMRARQANDVPNLAEVAAWLVGTRPADFTSREQPRRAESVHTIRVSPREYHSATAASTNSATAAACPVQRPRSPPQDLSSNDLEDLLLRSGQLSIGRSITR
jgi:hypothetical protein